MSDVSRVVAFFTVAGAPQTGLSATIRIRRIDTGALVETDSAMAEIGDGLYAFDFTSFDAAIADYSVRADGGAALGAERYQFGSLDATGFKVDQIRDGSIAADILAIAGGSTTEVRTGAAEADGFYDEMQLVVINAAGVVSRRVTGYLQVNGAFTVDPALPFTPALNDRVIVLARTASAALDAAVVAAIEKIRKVTTNRALVNATDTLVTIFEDDGSTAAFSFTVDATRRDRTPV